VAMGARCLKRWLLDEEQVDQVPKVSFDNTCSG
jgi:hypothetical protein